MGSTVLPGHVSRCPNTKPSSPKLHMMQEHEPDFHLITTRSTVPQKIKENMDQEQKSHDSAFLHEYIY